MLCVCGDIVSMFMLAVFYAKFHTITSAIKASLCFFSSFSYISVSSRSDQWFRKRNR